jgi:hypothetical protein
MQAAPKFHATPRVGDESNYREQLQAATARDPWRPEKMNVLKGDFFYKKSSSPAKVCPVCGDLIPLTRRAARDWDQIQFCSAVCRRNRGTEHPRAKAS